MKYLLFCYESLKKDDEMYGFIGHGFDTEKDAIEFAENYASQSDKYFEIMNLEDQKIQLIGNVNKEEGKIIWD